MADTPISGLPDGGDVQTTDQLPVNRSGSNFRVVVGDLAPLDTVATGLIDDNAVTFAKMQNIATQTIMGRTTAATGDPEALTATQTRTLLNVEDDAAADQVAADVPFTPAGTIAATDTQAAVEEVATDAAAATAAKSDITRTINAQTGTTYTFVLGDAGDVVTGANASATVFTIPAFASVAYAVGDQIDTSQIGAGVLTITGDTGVTVNGVSAGSGALSARYGSVTLLNLAEDVWLMTGNHDPVA